MVFERCAKDVDAGSDPRELAAFENLLSKCTHADAAALLAKRLKIIPNLARGGGWIVRRTVGNKPAIVGKVLKLAHFVGSGYVEVDIDLEASAMAKHILSVVTPLSQRLVIDIAFVLEGQDETELPERLLGGCRIHRINVAQASECRRVDDVRQD